MYSDPFEVLKNLDDVEKKHLEICSHAYTIVKNIGDFEFLSILCRNISNYGVTVILDNIKVDIKIKIIEQIMYIIISIPSFNDIHISLYKDKLVRIDFNRFNKPSNIIIFGKNICIINGLIVKNTELKETELQFSTLHVWSIIYDNLA